MSTVAASRLDVLIIEDDEDDAYLLKRALKQVSRERGLTVDITHSANGLDAMGLVARRDMMSRLPQVIVVDLNMPIMGGGHFLRALRTEMSLGDVRAVVLTTSTEKPIHDEARANGADLVFAKPNEQRELVAIARQIFDMGAGAVAA
jgi:CheY-like chemotaxis protein